MVEYDTEERPGMERREGGFKGEKGLIYYVRYGIPDHAGISLERERARESAETGIEQTLRSARPKVKRVELHPAGRVTGVKIFLKGALDPVSKDDLDVLLHRAMMQEVDESAERGPPDMAEWEIRCK